MSNEQRSSKELFYLQVRGAAHEPGEAQKLLQTLMTNREQAHLACLRGVIALHPDDALHFAGTSRNELDHLRSLRDGQLAQALRNLRDVAHREVSPRYSAALDEAFTLADIALGEFDSEGDVSRKADVGPGGGVRATHATGSAPSKPGAAEPPGAWQPIETAPKGGKWVLLWWPAVTDAPFVGYCVLGEWRAATSGDKWPRSPGPTHWMPLPAPPVCGPTKGEGHG